MIYAYQFKMQNTVLLCICHFVTTAKGVVNLDLHKHASCYVFMKTPQNHRKHPLLEIWSLKGVFRPPLLKLSAFFEKAYL